MRLDPINLYDYETRAQEALPHHIWDFIAGGAMDEVTTRRNRSAFEALALRPRFLRDISHRDLSTTVLGTEISLPVMIAPAGGHMSAHPDGELATARGAGMSKTMMILSTSSNYSLEEVAEAATEPEGRVVVEVGRENALNTAVLVVDQERCDQADSGPTVRVGRRLRNRNEGPGVRIH